MELKIYESDKKKDKVVRLALKESFGTVTLHCVDSNGKHIDNGNLLEITTDGKVSMMRGVEKDLGFPLNSRGSLKVEE